MEVRLGIVDGRPVRKKGLFQYPIYVPTTTKPGAELLRRIRRNGIEAAKVHYAAQRIARKDSCWQRSGQGTWILKTTRGDVVLTYDPSARDVIVQEPERFKRNEVLAMRLAYLYRARKHFKARAQNPRVQGG